MAKVFPWQQALWQQLVSRQNLAHAYLFYGAQGIGKRAFVEQLAAFLLCQHPQPLKACGQCTSCKLLAAETHPDIYHLEPEEAGKNIVIGQVRELVESLAQTPQQGGRQVVIVEPTEAMTIGASNALLKNLEEPSGKTIFLLVTHQISFLLPTIKSRCVLQQCPMPTAEQALAWLQANHQQPTETLQAALNLAAGSPLKAQGLLAQDALSQYQQVIDGVKKLFKQQVNPSDLAQAWAKIPQELIFDWFSYWAHAMLRFKLTQAADLIEDDEMAAVIKFVAPKANLENLLDMQNWLLEHRQKVLKRVPLRADLLLEALLGRWLTLLPRKV